MIDWGFAVKVGVVGFGLVFLVLVILAIAMWLTGLLTKRMDAGEKPAGDSKKGA